MKRADYQKSATPCCGRKPLIYMRDRHQFCCNCCRSYDLETEQQIPNFAWRKLADGVWAPTHADGDYGLKPGRTAPTEPATPGSQS